MKKKTNLVIDLKSQPISNRFLKKKTKKNKLYKLKLIQDLKSGLIKLEKPFPAKELKPIFDWITYSEPEEHLKIMMSHILKSKKIIDNNKSKYKLNIAGISFKDDSLLDLFNKKGHKTWRLDLIKDLNLSIGCGVETIQSKLCSLNSKKIIKKYGKSDVIIVRHIWEHVYNQNKFIYKLNQLLNLNGCIVFEIPDSSKLVRNYDYTMPWEEHLYYYSPRTFFESLNKNGLSIIFSNKINYSYEDVIYAIVKPSKIIKNKNLIAVSTLKKELSDAKKYSMYFEIKKKMVKDFFKKERKKGPIALFGAGHMSVSFISFFNISSYIDYVLDGNKNKIGLYMPIGNKKIYNPDILKMKNIKTCLLGMNPLHHSLVKNKYKHFKKSGGKFLSIYKNNFKYD